MVVFSATVRAEDPPLLHGALHQRRTNSMRCRYAFIAVCIALLVSIADAQAPRPDFRGVWGPYRGGRGGDPKLAAVPAGQPVLKPQYAKDFEARRAAEAAATQRGEPVATNGTL